MRTTKLIGINGSGYKFHNDTCKVTKALEVNINTNGGMCGGYQTIYINGKVKDLETSICKTFKKVVDGDSILINPLFISTAKEIQVVSVNVSKLKWNGEWGSACEYSTIGADTKKHFYAIGINDTYEIVERVKYDTPNKAKLIGEVEL